MRSEDDDPVILTLAEIIVCVIVSVIVTAVVILPLIGIFT